MEITTKVKCQHPLSCNNDAVYCCKIQYGIREDKDFYTAFLCDEHMQYAKKDSNKWYYIFSCKLLNGEEAPLIIKKRGRPKN